MTPTMPPLSISRFWLFIASCTGVLFLSVVVYLAVYLPWYKKINDSQMWDIHCPHAIPCATLCGSISIVSFTIAIWPVWGLLSPLIVFILVMGVIFASHFIPHCGKWSDWVLNTSIIVMTIRYIYIYICMLTYNTVQIVLKVWIFSKEVSFFSFSLKSFWTKIASKPHPILYLRFSHRFTQLNSRPVSSLYLFKHRVVVLRQATEWLGCSHGCHSSKEFFRWVSLRDFMQREQWFNCTWVDWNLEYSYSFKIFMQ